MTDEYLRACDPRWVKGCGLALLCLASAAAVVVLRAVRAPGLVATDVVGRVRSPRLPTPRMALQRRGDGGETRSCNTIPKDAARTPASRTPPHSSLGAIRRRARILLRTHGVTRLLDVRPHRSLGAAPSGRGTGPRSGCCPTRRSMATRMAGHARSTSWSTSATTPTSCTLGAHEVYNHMIGTQRTGKVRVPFRASGFKRVCGEWTREPSRLRQRHHYFTFRTSLVATIGSGHSPSRSICC